MTTSIVCVCVGTKHKYSEHKSFMLSHFLCVLCDECLCFPHNSTYIPVESNNMGAVVDSHITSPRKSSCGHKGIYGVYDVTGAPSVAALF